MGALVPALVLALHSSRGRTVSLRAKALCGLGFTAVFAAACVATLFGEGAQGESWDLASALMGSLTAPAVGLSLCFFTQGVMSIPPSPYVSDHNWVVFLLGYLVSLGALAGFAYSQRANFSLDNVAEKTFFLVPVFAVFLAYFSFVRMLDAVGALKLVLSVGWNVSFSAFLALTVLLTALKQRERGATVEQVCLPVVILCTASYAAGTAVHWALDNNAMYLQVVFSTLYVLGLSLLSTRRASLNEGQNVERRVGELAAAHQLSAREAEVLELLAKGYSIALVAEQICISVKTAHTPQAHLRQARRAQARGPAAACEEVGGRAV